MKDKYYSFYRVKVLGKRNGVSRLETYTEILRINVKLIDQQTGRTAQEKSEQIAQLTRTFIAELTRAEVEVGKASQALFLFSIWNDWAMLNIADPELSSKQMMEWMCNKYERDERTIQRWIRATKKESPDRESLSREVLRAKYSPEDRAVFGQMILAETVCEMTTNPFY
ncbi:hypothetical protein [Candidatus Cyanaurora vandensis]|uniref:hypothetical protein n=1 Tax=Candidatus Cyanaurora vandensis TaxID=2714958 RepID=UPI00257A6B48|nr:hypothetical protein [Candidatus Cyanaurora vandensis]